MFFSSKNKREKHRKVFLIAAINCKYQIKVIEKKKTVEESHKKMKNTQNTPQINENIKLFYDRNLFLTHTHEKHLHKHRKVNEN